MQETQPIQERQDQESLVNASIFGDRGVPVERLAELATEAAKTFGEPFKVDTPPQEFSRGSAVIVHGNELAGDLPSALNTSLAKRESIVNLSFHTNFSECLDHLYSLRERGLDEIKHLVFNGVQIELPSGSKAISKDKFREQATVEYLLNCGCREAQEHQSRSHSLTVENSFANPALRSANLMAISELTGWRVTESRFEDGSAPAWQIASFISGRSEFSTHTDSESLSSFLFDDQSLSVVTKNRPLRPQPSLKIDFNLSCDFNAALEYAFRGLQDFSKTGDPTAAGLQLNFHGLEIQGSSRLELVTDYLIKLGATLRGDVVVISGPRLKGVQMAAAHAEALSRFTGYSVGFDVKQVELGLVKNSNLKKLFLTYSQSDESAQSFLERHSDTIAAFRANQQRSAQSDSKTSAESTLSSVKTITRKVVEYFKSEPKPGGVEEKMAKAAETFFEYAVFKPLDLLSRKSFFNLESDTLKTKDDKDEFAIWGGRV